MRECGTVGNLVYMGKSKSGTGEMGNGSGKSSVGRKSVEGWGVLG